MKTPVDVLSKIFGGDRAMADALGVVPSSISNWRRTGIPDARKWQIRQRLRHSGLPDADYARALAALDGQVEPDKPEPRCAACCA